MPAPVLEICDLCSGYGSTRVVDGISLSVECGERLAVIGRNGMGKTTLLATLMGLTTRHGGDIRIRGTTIAALRPAARAQLGLGYVPQTRDIFASLTVEENLRAGLKGRGREALSEAYAMFPRLRERRRNYGRQLSGGEQQMLSIARTLLGKPQILLLDEPLEGLAPVICDELMAVFSSLAASSEMTILLVEQQIERALAFASRVVVLERGRVSWSGAPGTLSQDSDLVDRLIGVGIH
ncbi:MAG: ABC transporter ATP-binding protein [Alphaproteobacteria bacterium]|nr:ABC transporter ATP-binding protein [Alphaproteobacteria bacterium]